MTKFGQVVAYDKNAGIATIEFSRPEACEKCGACGTFSHKGSVSLRADCAVGNWVRMDFPESRFLQAATLAYGLPLVGFVAGLALGQFFTHSEGGAVLGAVLGLLLSIGVLWLNERRIKNRADWSAHVAEIYPDKPSPDALGCHHDGL